MTVPKKSSRQKDRRKSSKRLFMEKKRCSIDKCKKLQKDFIEGKPLCRIHSPMRRGFIQE